MDRDRFHGATYDPALRYSDGTYESALRQIDSMTDRRWDVVGVGESSIDFVYRLAGPVAPNTKVRIASYRVSPGGQVATALCTCARLGLRTAFIGTFGDDDHARRIRSTLGSHDVDTSHASERHGTHRYAVILLDGDSGQRTVLWHRDPALALTTADLDAQVIADARLLHVDNVDEEAAIAAAQIARTAGIHVTTDIDQVTSRTPELIRLATFPILAAHVPAALTGEADVHRAVRRLHDETGNRVCVTLGERGALLADGETLYYVPAFAVETVDTTGAGDVFRGALIHALLRGDGPEAMLRFANAAAAISCTREGAIGGIPTLAEVERLLG